MHEEQRVVLAIAARLLSYPEETASSDEFVELKQAVEEDVKTQQLKQQINAALDELGQIPLQERREMYVDVFDWKEKTGMYLTAHEHGDDRKRGAAMIKLQKVISEAGFERHEGELTDYMPMLYELLAVAQDAKVEEKLHSRLARATWRVAGHIADDHPYKQVLTLLTDFVFETPTDEEMEKMGEENPDLDTMPFPITYE